MALIVHWMFSECTNCARNCVVEPLTEVHRPEHLSDMERLA